MIKKNVIPMLSKKKVRNRLHEEFFAVSEKVRECTAFLTTNQDKEVHEDIKSYMCIRNDNDKKGEKKI